MQTIATIIIAVLAAIIVGVFFIAYRAWRNREAEESLKDAEAQAQGTGGGGGPKEPA